MILIVDWFLVLILFSYSVIAVYLLAWLMISLAFRPNRISEPSDLLCRFAILVPAHNEELLIGKLIDSTLNLNYPRHQYDVFVIADNCSDSTAAIARSKGVHCLERTDLQHRGKPFALNWAFSQIQVSAYDGFVIVDADTLVDSEFLHVMGPRILDGHHVLQGYFGISNPRETWLTHLMVIPGVLKYKFRYRGKATLGFPCPLMGNGMCFSKEIIQKYGWDAFTLTENWEYFISLFLRGYTSSYAEAYIYSQTASTMRQGETQRKRWFKGKIQCVVKFAPTLLNQFYRSLDLRALDCLIELVMPSISMFMNGAVFLLFISSACWALSSTFLFHASWALVLNLTIFAYFLMGIIANRSPLQTYLALLHAPVFLAWKAITTCKALLTYKDKEWVKTKRH